MNGLLAFLSRNPVVSLSQWCKQNNFTIHTNNYWKHVLKEELASQILPNIVPVSLPEIQTQMLTVPAPDSSLANRAIRATAKLTINDVSVEFDSDIPEDFLRTILRRCVMLKDAELKYFAGIYIVCGYTDLRYGIDSLAAIIERKCKVNLFIPNTLFLFCGKSSTKIKGLLWKNDVTPKFSA